MSEVVFEKFLDQTQSAFLSDLSQVLRQLELVQRMCRVGSDNPSHPGYCMEELDENVSIQWHCASLMRKYARSPPM